VLQQWLRAAQARRTVVASAAGARGTRLFAIRGGCARCAGVDHGSPSRWNTGLAPGTERVIERSGDRAIYAATPRIAALLQSSYIVYDLAIWRTTLQRYVLLVPANRCDASLLVHRLRSSDRLCDATCCWCRQLAPAPFIILRQRSGDIAIDSAALLFPGMRDSPLRHTSSFVSDRATSQSILQLYCFPVLETRPCAIRRPSSAIGRPHDSVLGIDDGAARSGQAIDPASQPFLQITRCRAVANGSDRHCFRTRSSDAS